MENEIDLSETLIGLAAHYSPSGQEQNAVKWLKERMDTLGYDQTFIDEAGNCVGIIGQGKRQFILLGHIDTVPGEIEVHIADGILYGRGVVDAKGPLACFVDAVAQVGAVADWQIIVIGTVEEESSSKGARFVADRYHPEFAVIGEPNHWDRIALGYKGTACAGIMIRGEQVHSASGSQTTCEAAFKVWQNIQSFAASFNSGKTRAFDQILPTLSAFKSGQEEFAQWAQMQIGVRLPPDFSPEQWYNYLNQLAQDCDPAHLKVTIDPIGTAIPAWSCEKNNKLVRAFLASIRGEGGTPAFVYKTGTADLNIVAPVWQCPGLVYGPGDSALDHTPNEKLSLAEYQKSKAVLVKALQQITRPG
jgi:LysW-gamma-L-lysine carboxypeptidase